MVLYDSIMSVSTKVYVGNLPETCRRVELQKLFEKYGSVVECDIVKNYGFVHFAEEQDAKNAVDALNGQPFEGTNLKVEISHSKVRQKPGMGGKGECYRCGKEGHWSKDCPKGPTKRRDNRDPYGRDPYGRSPYADPYYAYRDRYPPPPMDRYRPYPDPYDRRPAPPPRDPYFRDRGDPYARPPPEYYGRRSPARNPYYDGYYDKSSYEGMASNWHNTYSVPPPPGTSQGRMSPSRSRVTAPY